MSLRVRVAVPVAQLEVHRGRGLRVEQVHVLPRAVEKHLLREQLPALHQPAPVVRRVLLPAVGHRQRGGERERAHAGVGQPVAAVQRDADEHVRQAGGDLGRHLPAHTGDHRLGGEAQRAEREQQQVVLLETIAPAPVADEFLLQRGEVRSDRPAEQDVEVFKRDRADLPPQDVREHFARDCPRAGVTDTGKVGVEVS